MNKKSSVVIQKSNSKPQLLTNFHKRIKKIKYAPNRNTPNLLSCESALTITKLSIRKLEKSESQVSQSSLNTKKEFFTPENDSYTGPIINRISTKSPELLSPYRPVKELVNLSIAPQASFVSLFPPLTIRKTSKKYRRSNTPV